MHDVLNRQLIAPAIALLLFGAASQSRGEPPREATATEQVQAAQLMQATLAARGAGPEEWRKLDETYTALVAKFPRDATVRNARAEYLWDLGEQARAMVEWETAAQLDPANSGILEHLGGAALALGEVKKSADYYSRAVAIDPNNAANHFALANVWFLFRHELLDVAHPDDRSLLRGALAHFAEASRLAPANAEYARAYAETFYNVPEPDWEAALAAWENFRRLSPQQDFALLQLTRVHLKLSHIDAAKDCLSKIQSPDYQVLKARLTAQAEARSPATEKEPASPR